MKSLRLTSAPTRSRRLNELLGLIVLVAAALLLLALASYTPTDPSFNTVGGYATGRPAHNWAGILGAYVADLLLQAIGVAAFFLPLLLARLGVCWMQSRPAGSPWAKAFGLGLWALFAPAAVALLPGHLRWQHALPIEGTVGRLLSDFLVHYLNLPGACIVVALAVSVALYLATTFTFNTASEWLGRHFGFLRRLQERWAEWKFKRQHKILAAANTDQFGSKREAADRLARLAAEREREASEAAARAAEPQAPEPENTTLLGGLFGWWSRRKQPLLADATPADSLPSVVPAEPVSMWQAMPRTDVDALPVTAFDTAAAAAAPFADELARAAEPRRALDDLDNFATAAYPDPAAAAPHEELDAFELPEPPLARVPAPRAPKPTAPPPPARPLPPQALAAEPTPLPSAPNSISFGKRADSDLKSVAITPKSIRGYKLPPSSLLYHSEEHATVREDALREEARILVEKCGEFDVDGQVTQINPGPVVTTFEFKPDAGVKYSSTLR